MTEIEAKSICVHKLEDLLVDPMFTIFHVQHNQIASRTETQNSLLFHFKSSMAKVRQWNATTVKDFCDTLMTRFPALGTSFERLFLELQELTCRILNESSESSTYEPIRAETWTYLHSFISACSDAFISNPDWFAVEESSTEYQTCKNNSKTRMQQANVVENTVMNFVKVGPKKIVENITNILPIGSFAPSADVESDMSIESDKSESEKSESEKSESECSESDKSSESSKLDEISINMVNGGVEHSEKSPQFSTPFIKTKKSGSEKSEKSIDSEMDSEIDSEKSTEIDSVSEKSTGSMDSVSDSSEYSSESDSESISLGSSDFSSDSSDLDTEEDCSDNSSSQFSCEDDTGTSSQFSTEDDTGSETSIGDNSSSSENASGENTLEVPVEMMTQILSLKDRRHRKKKKKST